jgi:hypothetical protein
MDSHDHGKQNGQERLIRPKDDFAHSFPVDYFKTNQIYLI